MLNIVKGNRQCGFFFLQKYFLLKSVLRMQQIEIHQIKGSGNLKNATNFSFSNNLKTT